MANRDYNAAVQALNTLQSNAAAVKAVRDSGPISSSQAIPEVIELASRIGYKPSDFAAFRPIHVAGTKGKGSTSAFISSILGQYVASPDPKAPRKIGLYTSPHLRSVRERIQINNEPISEPLFAQYFFDIWDRLSTSGDGSKPMYFRYLTLMAFHLFVREGVDSAVIECGIGGEFDTTNVIPAPTVAVVTALGIDHVSLLGGTLPEIAWHKAGIFKPGAIAMTVPQPDDAMEVLRKRAAEAQCDLLTIPTRPGIADSKIKLGLSGEHQKTNASVAVVAAAKHLAALGVVGIPDPLDNPGLLPREFHLGLERVKLAGRCDLRLEAGSKITWCLDGAHTLESIEVAAQWFSTVSVGSSSSATMSAHPISPRPRRIMIFNQQSRDAAALARALHRTLSTTLEDHTPFNHCIFTTNVTYRDAGYKADLVSMNDDGKDVETLKVQRKLAHVWSELDPSARTSVTGNIEEAVQLTRQIALHSGADSFTQVLITGSLHLVGGAIEVLENGI